MLFLNEVMQNTFSHYNIYKENHRKAEKRLKKGEIWAIFD